jgi:hypothetical protein
VAPPIPRHCLFFHIYLVGFRHRCFSFQFIYKYFKLYLHILSHVWSSIQFSQQPVEKKFLLISHDS